MEYHETEQRRQGEGRSPERDGAEQHNPMRAFCEDPPAFIQLGVLTKQHKIMIHHHPLQDPTWSTPRPQLRMSPDYRVTVS